MANALFGPGREGFLAGEIDWDTAVIKCILLRSYTYDSTDKFVSDLSGASIVATSAAFGTKTVTNGTADAADVTFSAVSAGAAITNAVIYQSSAVGGGGDVANTLQRVIAFIDSGFPVTPNGGDITIAWDNGANKIFTL
jgi:hypothetical protein